MSRILAAIRSLENKVQMALDRAASLLPSVLVAQQRTAWFIDPVAGKPTNDGRTALTAIDSWASVAKRYTAGIPGLRPTFNPTGGVCTITLLGTTPTSDPASVLLSANYANGAQVIVVGSARAPTRTSTFTTASAFVRTSASGEIAVTDVTLADWHPLVPSLLVDVTSGAVGFLAEPATGPNATANLSVGYGPQTAGVFSLPAQTNYAANDTYELVPLWGMYLGAGLDLEDQPGNSSTATPSIWFYRIQFESQFSGEFCIFSSLSSFTIGIQECLTGQEFVALGEVALNLANVGSTSPFVSHVSTIGATLQIFAGGFGYAGTVAGDGGGSVTLDGDWALFGDTNRAHRIVEGGQMFVGQSSAWMAGNNSPMSLQGGYLTFAPQFSGCVWYGNSNAGACVQITYTTNQSLFPSVMRYPNNQAVATLQFNGTPTVAMPSTPFSPNLSTGVYVGPTTATAAHLDAVLGAGTGLAGIAVDLKLGARIVGS